MMKRLLLALVVLLMMGIFVQSADAGKGARNAAIDTQRILLLMMADEANNDVDNPYGYKIAPLFYQGGLFGKRKYIGYNLIPVLKSPVQAVPYQPPAIQPALQQAPITLRLVIE